MTAEAGRRAPPGVDRRWLAAGALTAAASAVVALALGPTSLPLGGVVVELAGRLPGVDATSSLSSTQAAILTEIRAPRILLSLLVGACLASAGASYQGVFRNPLADPYLLGVAAGAGLGATVVIVAGGGEPIGPVATLPAAAFAGALVAVGASYLLGLGGDGRRSTSSLILAGVAVAALLSAAQSYLLQRDDENLRDVYAWLLGRFNTASWADVRLLAPVAVACVVVLVLAGRRLDVLAVGDAEAEGLGVHPGRIRLVVVLVATLATGAAVAVSGLIGFVGIIVPHTVRLLVGSSHRQLLPLVPLFGGAFLCLADLGARTLLAPAEVPIGVLTALVGAPFFLFVLRLRRAGA